MKQFITLILVTFAFFNLNAQRAICPQKPTIKGKLILPLKSVSPTASKPQTEIPYPETKDFSLPKVVLMKNLKYVDAADEKREYTYSGSGELLKLLVQGKKKGDISFTNQERYTYTYDDRHNLLTESIENWNIVTSLWKTIEMKTYTYDNKNNLLTKTEKSWNADATPELMITYSYDEANNLQEILYVQRNSSVDRWQNTSRSTYTYGMRNNLNSHIGEYWNGNSWVVSAKRLFTYNGDDYILTDTNFDMSGYSSDWRTVYTYDVNNHVLSQASEYYNKEVSKWEVSRKASYVYDVFGNFSYETVDIYNNNDYFQPDVESETYDARGNVIGKTVKKWNSSSDKWENNRSYTYTYGEKNDLLTTTSLYWDSQSGKWLNQERTVFNYDNQNRYQDYIIQRWDKLYTNDSGVDAYGWRSREKYAYTYDDNDNILTNSHSYWDSSLNVWSDPCLFTFEYDNYDNCIYAEHKDVAYVGIADTSYIGGIYYNNMRDFYTCKQASQIEASYVQFSIATGIEQVQNNKPKIVVYPNPTSGEITIAGTPDNIEKIKLLDTNGRLLFETTEKRMDLSPYFSGLYFLQIKTSKGITTEKIIKK